MTTSRSANIEPPGPGREAAVPTGGWRRRRILAGLAAGVPAVAGGLLLSSCIDGRPGPGPSGTPSPGPSATAAPPTDGTTHDPEDPFRPAYHYSPQDGNMADPNGLVEYEGEYHLFHQQDGTWAHAVSTDLMTWEPLDTALEHDDLGLAMSGSCVVDGANTSGLLPDGGLVALYTSTTGGEAQSLAYSSDRGRTWTRYEGNPVIANDGRKDFRDPKVFWHEGSTSWVMIVSAGDHVEIHRSPDLKTWTWASSFGQDQGSHAAVWECPDLFPLKDVTDDEVRWVMTVSVGDNQETAGSTAQYFIGDFDGTTFFPEDDQIRFTDAGQDFYAAQSFEKIEGRRVWMAWMGNWRYPYSLPTEGWHGEMSVPRELSLTRVDGVRRLRQVPVPELEAFLEESADLAGMSAKDGVSELGTGRCVQIDVELDVSQAQDAWLSLARSEGSSTSATGSEVRVGVDTAHSVFYLDRSAGDLEKVANREEGAQEVDFALRREVPYTPVDGKARLRVLLDRSSLEVFVDDGATVGSFLVFNDAQAQGIALGATGTVSVLTGSLTPVAQVEAP
ncbi:glycoside hydrolase family 32 protein [Actinomyces slackii]|uniref:Levanase n=1 Tax=Actinomyces slackii TaxID=52774 RepID=A0A448K9J8_9ACTO|nr:glycoside hydrolase family 32 protein [Actinomyces slackii]VEG73592.1 Levanase precursor [Actinomyces slackii]